MPALLRGQDSSLQKTMSFHLRSRHFQMTRDFCSNSLLKTSSIFYQHDTDKNLETCRNSCLTTIFAPSMENGTMSYLKLIRDLLTSMSTATISAMANRREPILTGIRSQRATHAISTSPLWVRDAISAPAWTALSRCTSIGYQTMIARGTCAYAVTVLSRRIHNGRRFMEKE